MCVKSCTCSWLKATHWDCLFLLFLFVCCLLICMFVSFFWGILTEEFLVEETIALFPIGVTPLCLVTKTNSPQIKHFHAVSDWVINTTLFTTRFVRFLRGWAEGGGGGRFLLFSACRLRHGQVLIKTPEFWCEQWVVTGRHIRLSRSAEQRSWQLIWWTLGQSSLLPADRERHLDKLFRPAYEKGSRWVEMCAHILVKAGCAVRYFAVTYQCY